MTKSKIAIICGGKTAFQTIQLLGLEKNLVAIAIGGKDKESADILEQFSKGANLPFEYITSSNEQEKLADWLKKSGAEYVFSINFPFYLTAETLNLLPDRWFNFHMGPLPEFRGPMPIFEVLKAGLSETSIAVHKMVPDVDEGPIVFQEPIKISSDETFGSLAVKMRDRVSQVALNLIQMLEFGSNLPLIEQDDDQSEYFPKPELEETRITWENMNADEIVNLVNACNPWNNGADVVKNGMLLFKIVFATSTNESHEFSPGTVIQLNSELVSVACIENTVLNIHIVCFDYGILPAKELNRIQIGCGTTFI